MIPALTRRTWLQTAAASVGAGLLPAVAHAAEEKKDEPFRYCLNTSTISGQKLPIAQVVDIAAKAGYFGIEPWIRELDQHVKEGGNLKDLGKRIKDQGLTVESAIGFAPWLVEEDDARKLALEQARRDMDMVLQIGGTRIAAPPAGATKLANLNPSPAAERYRALRQVGAKIGAIPQVELWGFSQALSRLGECAFTAIESGHRQACILTDVYHIYKGGSDFAGLRLLSGVGMHVLHVNDYPAQPARADITDAHRVYPGDGVAPLGSILRDLEQSGFRGALSLELFNRDYWKQDALLVARTGLEKTRAAVQARRKG